MKKRSPHHNQKTWAELCCLGWSSCMQLFWARVVLRKWLNMGSNESDYSADPVDDDDDGDDFDYDPGSGSDNEEWGGQSRFMNNRGNEAPLEPNEYTPRLRRQKSSTYRSQYINSKELKICVGTWNVGGRLPPDDQDIDDWLRVNEPADIYVLGLQEIVPLNPGNIFGAEDTRPVPKWENIIRETLNRVRPSAPKIKSFSDPPSPSKFKPSDDVSDIEEEILLESDSDIGEEVHPLDEEHNVYDGGTDGTITDDIMKAHLSASDAVDIPNSGVPVELALQRQFSFPKRFDRLHSFNIERSSEKNMDTSFSQQTTKLTRMLSGSERIGLSWPEPPLHLLSQRVLQRPTSFKSVKSFKSSKSFKAYNSFKSIMNDMPGMGLLPEIDLEALMKRKRRSSYVRIMSKQMVGIFITIWVRRSLRKHIQNLKVSTVGVGIMGYIGNKGSISVSMSIYQTLFCFVCTHLTSGEKEGDEHKRNSDVHEILRRTHFHSVSYIGLPKKIIDHERIILFGDLNYRINLPNAETRALISKKQWPNLVEKDQLMRELKNGGVFGGWSEGTLDFPPTYKYEINSDKYHGEDPRIGKRSPAWCDRILSYGKGMRLLSYRRAELKLSDHRPVSATYMAEVEAFCPRKLQRALTFTDAEIENEEVITNLGRWGN
ncbi:PREDICTED: type IV inositol polyphosphate 5-phosphatase 3-like isoform X1 [Lupinus angustifolius]|nr:PREDICTED: type IV inositol polyphosphate 5-phosphatase 3-like isoform X1 [Lupinus angustifolius]XP_019439379.1 PREDICTED: type IV inositol polyphosphate 5-phosphatase 3-like isoform X1 [Lupinus angustifolius]XP_019439380.1 PREDICTED: type IV inositol polyphosphate 5-phosphatase 3-like isoform X1 [Lupinus angustifolius]XP_019439381.1 PREDICTED: type IV inositol polyphosphate 5-phosphatase 3-like isoform X1 [Lupinus angustifolius]XP_019439382.1 PREDICTED: type IV inositol polyphosphate 5-phos